MWHSKAKCPTRATEPLKAVYKAKGTVSPFKDKNPSDRLKIAYKGKSERSQAIGYADKFFSLYIRNRAADGIHNWCFTCDAKMLIRDLQCGHFIARRYLNTRWHEVNCWPQCNDCNVEKRGNLKEYERRLIKLFGQDAIDELRQLAQSINKVSTAEIQAIADKYEHKRVVF